MENTSFFKVNAKYLILVMAVIMIMIGIVRKENEVVLQKAIKICLECIGIG